MISQFLNKKENQKIDIFQYLLFEKGFNNRKKLEEKFKLSTSTLRRYLQELSTDLMGAFGDAVIIHNEPNQDIIVELDLNLTPDQVISNLRYYYVKESSLYLLLKSLIKKKYSSISEISQELNFSDATVYRLLLPIKKMLATFGVTLSFEANNNFEGNELGVRYFLYIIYWNLFHTLQDSPFTQNFPKEFIDLDFLKKNLGIKKELSQSQITKLTLISGIISYRIVYFKKRVELSNEFLEDIQYFYKGTPSLNIEQFNVPLSVVEKESKLHSFLVRGLIFDLDTYEGKEKIVNQYRNSDLVIAKNVDYFLKMFSQYFSLTYTKENYTESYYLLLMTYIYVKHIHFNIDEYLENPVNENISAYKNNKRYIKLLPTFKEFLKFLPFKLDITETDIHSFTLLLYTIYEINSSPVPINIYVTHTSNIATPPLIKSGIKKVFNSELIHFCDSPHEADIIISNTFEGYHQTTNIFYFHNPSKKEIWEDLFRFISQYIFKNIFEQ